MHERRTPPFGIVEDSNRRLGNYTHSHETVNKSTYSCYSIGECEVCSPLEKKTQPYCSEFGNKQAVRCEWDDPELADRKSQTMIYDDDSISLPSFQSCPRVKMIEQKRLIRFEVTVILTAIVSITIFIWRQKKITQEQYQRLAKRIGVTII
ncbi:uncharacterized protein RHIMIDRAFT_101276 [Rhizopus microsporus ATCC 52813]|uniref:Uncharacterized protein n=1 Tax=Rhizopus microsporus ATCC 52813 TaxID=1340429 RepID=A0A2G4SEW7_RHIZD|nr:uncharacterized protein RHIMIDRAFT_101276 [Rhizopus microsporus ATCC 52813]PHZ07322.1 hypothetical protein RHIMIDRAFT_101276 [Rhizopus microsporus ATCC 52813]